MDTVIIVESPSKSHTIQSYLGNGYVVMSSKGHISDLSTTGKGGLGIDIENGFKPNYVIMPDKKKLVSDLQKACKGKNVLLATDPDREGEAIAYHLAQALNLNLNDNNRIEFHEITKSAVKEALKNPHPINIKMFESQESRRMIDRILGFKLSTLLQKKIQSKSAGRVQSVALLLVVNLEEEILAFVPEKYFEMEALFGTFKAKLTELDNKKITPKNRIKDRKILEDLKPELKEFIVSNIEKKSIKRQSQPTFTTSTLEQDASNKLGFSSTKTMQIAQGLYEGKNVGSETVGLITYMRTDSTRLAESFVSDATEYIKETFGDRYLGYVKSKNQKGMQDAHEGIRPTSIYRTPDSIKQYLSSDEYKLYSLIYKRTLASLMASSVFEQTKVTFTNTRSIWETNGLTLMFDGYLKVYGKSEDDENQMLPTFNLDEKYNAIEINILDKKTEPKKRYTEASLIKEMEELGIGRPSTYAQTIKTLLDREYITSEKKFFKPTEQGILTTKKLLEYFSSIINVEYTAKMELDLDKIAQGEKKEIDEMNEFYSSFMPLYENAKENMEANYPILTDEICPNCGSNLVIRKGKYGEFLACSNYPKCKYIKQDETEVETTHVKCPNCNDGELLIKVATRGKNKGNKFYPCSNYPKCKTVFNDIPTENKCPNCGALMLMDKDSNLYCSEHCENKANESLLCPVCGKGNLILRVANRGKNKGNEFYGCSNYPKCKTLISLDDYNRYKENPKAYIESLDNNKQEEVTSEDEILCPKCKKGHMIKRVATRGANKGNVFYGCSNYPKCKNIITSEEYDKLKIEK